MSFEPDGVVTLLPSGPHGSWATMAATPVPIAWTTAFGVRSMAYAAWRRAAEGLETQTGMSGGFGKREESDDSEARARRGDGQVDVGPTAQGGAVLAARGSIRGVAHLGPVE